MKTLFVEPPLPPGCWVLRDNAGKFGTRTNARTVYPPLDFAYAAAVLEKNGYEFDLIDALALNLGVKEVLERVSIDEPALVIVNTSAVSLASDLNIACLIKERLPGSHLCVTGSLPSVIPEVAMSKQAIDIVIRGEIEYTIMELLKAIEDGHLKDVNGIAFKKHDAIIRNPDRPLNHELDELPFPAYHHLPIDQYCYSLLPKRPFIAMLASRGCPYGCVYCPYPIGFGNVWRGRSPVNVLNEIQFLVEKFGVKSIDFRDQVFTFDMKRTEEICRGILERGIDIEWRCETRVDKVSKKLMLIMKEAGCVGLHMGVESGDSRILTTVAKKGINIKMTRQAFTEARNVGIETFAFFMIGLPGETRRSIWESYKLAKKIDPDIVQFMVVTPYPGTELYRIAEKKGWILTKDWTKYNGFDVVMRTDELSEQDITSARNYLEGCLTNRSRFLENTATIRKDLLNVFPVISTFAKRFSSAVRYCLRHNAEKQFEQWALQN